MVETFSENVRPGGKKHLSRKRLLIVASVLTMVIGAIVLLWFTVDESLNDLTLSWLESAELLDKESMQLLETFSQTQQYLRGNVSDKDFFVLQSRLGVRCNSDISACLQMALVAEGEHRRDQLDSVHPPVPLRNIAGSMAIESFSLSLTYALQSALAR